MTTNTGGPAFPVPGLHTNNDYDGMTLRDHFAGLAMQGVVSSVTDGAEINPDMCAAWSYEMADAMLKARIE
jgi:hypothetical protein